VRAIGTDCAAQGPQSRDHAGLPSVKKVCNCRISQCTRTPDKNRVVPMPLLGHQFPNTDARPSTTEFRRGRRQSDIQRRRRPEPRDQAKLRKPRYRDMLTKTEISVPVLQRSLLQSAGPTKRVREAVTRRSGTSTRARKKRRRRTSRRTASPRDAKRRVPNGKRLTN